MFVCRMTQLSSRNNHLTEKVLKNQKDVLQYMTTNRQNDAYSTDDNKTI